MLTTVDYCIFFCMVVIPVIVVVILIYFSEYFKSKTAKKWNKIISDVKKELEDAGFIYNHSYQLVNKEDNTKIRFLRIFELKYNPNTEKVYAHCYMTTKDNEIGTWYDDYKYLVDIPTRWNITDNGEWNV